MCDDCWRSSGSKSCCNPRPLFCFIVELVSGLLPAKVCNGREKHATICISASSEYAFLARESCVYVFSC
jgi:hypothetical protein